MAPPLPVPAPASGGDVLDFLSPYMGVFFVSFVVAFCLTPLMRRLANRHGIVDWPDHKRKAHLEPIAYLGGIAIFLGWLAGVVLCYFIALHSGDPGALEHVNFPLPIIFGATVITLTGLVDDTYRMSPRVKIGGQFVAAAAVAYRSDLGPQLVNDFCVSIGFPLSPEICYVLGAAVVAIFIVGACNSMNLLDGLDGLAAGVAAIAAAGFLFIAMHVAAVQSDPTLTDPNASPVRIVMCLAVLGAVLGFLPFNFNPANIFMGDTGSLLLGYLSISTILLFASVPPVNSRIRGPSLVMAALIVFALPITDTLLAIVRRRMRGQPIFSPDNEHLHHQLLRAGLSVRRAVLVLYAIAACFAVLGASMVFFRLRYVLACFMVLFSFIIVTAYKAGHRDLLLRAREGPAADDAAPVPPPTQTGVEADTRPLSPAPAAASQATPAAPAPAMNRSA